jgi:hypothetical protein
VRFELYVYDDDDNQVLVQTIPTTGGYQKILLDPHPLVKEEEKSLLGINLSIRKVDARHANVFFGAEEEGE